MADRFHLLVNAGEALERVLARKHARLREAASAVDRLDAQKREGKVKADPATKDGEAKPPTRKEREKQARQDRRRARYDAVRELADQGWGIQTIARHLRMGRKTVRRMLRAGS